MSGPHIGRNDRLNLSVLHGTSSTAGPSNHRDASNPSNIPWKNAPTPIPVPAIGERRPQVRSNQNPFTFNNTLTNNKRRPGNPNTSQTVLAQARADPSDSRAAKRQRIEIDSFSSGPNPRYNGSGINGTSSSSTRGAAPRRGSVSEPEIQVLERPSAAKNQARRKSIPNDANIMVIDDSSDDLGVVVTRGGASVARGSSPDPLLIGAPEKPSIKHAFETLPGQLNSATSSKGKGRARDDSKQVVSASEEDDDIEEFTSDSPWMELPPRSTVKQSPAIPNGIVSKNREKFERNGVPQLVLRSIPKRDVPTVDLISVSRSVVGKMKKKGEPPTSTSSSIVPTFDTVGTSSSNFIKPASSTRRKDGVISLPLEAWHFGHKLFESDDPQSPHTFNYNRQKHTLTVSISGRPPRHIVFRLDRDMDAVKITNDATQPLKDNVVIQFQTTRGIEWRQHEAQLQGCFKAGSSRYDGQLIFRFSTTGPGWTSTDYQEMVTLVRKEINTVDILRPSAGGSIWQMAKNASEMYQQQQSRGEQEEREDPVVKPRSASPSSSFSTRTRASKHDPNPAISEAGPSARRRSTRQSAIHTIKSSPPPPPPPEPDELILMYPPTGTGALSIMRSDLKRLGPEEFLNDTLIEFGLKLWLNDLREKDPGLADQIHVFSSFFYKKLNNKKNAEEGYQSVRKWTSKVDLFSKKYVIVPINENIHWYLAIIYQPGHTLEPPLPPPPSPISRTTRKRKKEQEQEQPEVAGEAKAEVEVEAISVPEPPEAEISAPAAPTSEKEPIPEPEPECGADTSSVNATRATTPSLTQDEEMGDVSISAFRKSCSITAISKPPSVASSRTAGQPSSPPPLLYPPSDYMDVDTEEPVVADLNPPPDDKLEVMELLTSKPPSKSSGVPPTRFYGSASNKEKEKAVGGPVVVVDSEDGGDDQQQEAEVDDMLTVTQPQAADGPPQTHIFTLDSLGTRHPQAIKVLKQYLVREAKDKRNFDEVRDAVGKQVQVPVQPNTWDCGVYLLHLTKVFMNAPEQFLEHILTTRGTIQSAERKKRWEDHEVPQFRDHLISRITELSESWKADKVAREEEAKKRKSEEAEVLSSEGEVDILEDVSAVKAAPAPKQNRYAARLRG
ncbi:hypothetical protein HYDPIDRAFT_114280 [Hydnomerulius pinastri MD-312]|uniref:Ubiquitin-like protease family profile domain-containing protein n=1 Tax=Hydnomerulius pinastri MD-312 TaxID=994086 RepID=A0A0C9WD14_9AGAM|nr:hypothetical protein HYDPIDRAFT_114280 [Hydnomerulius pinastri MD-312]